MNEQVKAGAQPMDVLAVLDDLYAVLSGPAAEQCEQARAAVADLARAHREAVDFIGKLPGAFCPPSGMYQRWRSALARCGVQS